MTGEEGIRAHAELERLQAENALLRAELTERPWYHLNGSLCVAGHDPGTGTCSAGAGPVTPCPQVMSWIAAAVTHAVADGGVY